MKFRAKSNEISCKIMLQNASKCFNLLHAHRCTGVPPQPSSNDSQAHNLLARRRHHALQLDHLLPLFDNQARQLGVRQAVPIIRRRHAQNESDSHPPVDRIIVRPRILPLLQTYGNKMALGRLDRCEKVRSVDRPCPFPSRHHYVSERRDLLKVFCCLIKNCLKAIVANASCSRESRAELRNFDAVVACR